MKTAVNKGLGLMNLKVISNKKQNKRSQSPISESYLLDYLLPRLGILVQAGIITSLYLL